MARNGSGTFTPSIDFTTEAGTPPIEIAKLDTALTDVGDELTNSIAADGQTNPSANLPMNGFKHTNVANAAARNEYASAADVQDQDLVYFVDSGAANAYVITPVPAISSYENGQRFVFQPTNPNTGTSTLEVSGLGPIAIRTLDNQILSGGELLANIPYEVTLSGSIWYLTSPTSEISDAMLSSNIPLLNASANFSGSVVDISSASTPRFGLVDTNAAADEGSWVLWNIDGELGFVAATDAGYPSSGITAFRILRTGTTIDEIELNATLVDVNGNLDVSGSLVLGTPLAVSEGGTGATTDTAARENLGEQLKMTTSQVSNSTTTLTDHAELSGFTLEADTRYAVDAYIPHFSSSTNPDLQYIWQFSNTPQDSQQAHFNIHASVEGQTNNMTSQMVAQSFGIGGAAALHLKGGFHSNASTGGTLDFQFAQNTSDAQAIFIDEGAWIKITKV